MTGYPVKKFKSEFGKFLRVMPSKFFWPFCFGDWQLSFPFPYSFVALDQYPSKIKKKKKTGYSWDMSDTFACGAMFNALLD